MATRSIELVLKARVDGMVNGLKTAQTAATNAGRDLNNFRKNQEEAFNTLGRTFTVGGAAITAAVGMTAKAAMDWQTAWAGVQKTNDGTSTQMEQLESDLRDLAKTLPATHAEIAATAEAAGQLGVGVDDVAEFTETMINLGETTNLSAEEAATALARLSNITGTSFSDVDRLGSALVGLGNNFATTEAEILHMSERLAAAGTQAGLSEGELLGLATAMSSVGIEAEAGGTAMTQTFNNIDKAVREGGEGLSEWARIAGVSATDFAETWRNEPAQAIQLVVEGLGNIQQSGGDVAGTLDELGIKGIRQADTLRRLASAGELVGEAFAMGNEEFDKNSALAAEAALRYETAESKIAIAWNNIKDAAITAGEALLPVIGNVADVVGDLAGWFSELPAPATGAITAISGIAGVSALALGGLATLVPKVLDTVDAFKTLNTTAPGTSKVLRGVGKAAGVAVGIAAVAIALNAVQEAAGPTAASTQEMVAAVNKLNEAGDSTSLNEIFSIDQGTAGEIDGIAGALNHVNFEWYNLIGHAASFLDTIGLRGLSGVLGEVKAEFEGLDSVLAAMEVEEASDAMNQLRIEAEAAGNMDLSSWSALEKNFPNFTESIREMANEVGASTEAADLFQYAMGNLPPQLQEVKDAADQAAQQEELTGALEEVGLAADGTVESLADYLDMLFQTGLAEMSARDAQAKFHDSIRAVGDAVDQLKDPESGLGGLSAALNKSKDDFDLTTEAGALANSAFQDITRAGMDAASAMAENGAAQEDVQAQLQSTYDALVEAAGQFGITGEQADALARSVLGIDDEVSIESWMSDTAKETADATKESVTGIPSEATIDSWMSDEAFVEALRTRAAVLDIPEEDVIDSFMSSAARDEADDTTAAVLGIPPGASITSWMSDSARKEAQSTNQWLNTIDGRHTTSQHTHTTTTIENRVQNFKQTGRFFNTSSTPSYGPVAPRRAMGGRLPYTGLGRDMILGIGSHGQPTALVDDGEWVIREESARKYDRALSMINQDHPAIQHLARYQGGGSPGREWSASQAWAASPQVIVQQANSGASELTGTLYLESGALLGEVRMAVRDPQVTREVSQSLASQQSRDRRGAGVR